MTTVFDHKDFADHEQVVHCQDSSTGLQAIIAIHNTNRGPALGGCRMWPYASDRDALADVLRLSRGMTYKSAMANLDLGGGKAVIIGDPRTDKKDALLRSFGRFLQGLGGRFIVAEDSGTSVADIKIIAEESEYVAGIADKTTADGTLCSGDPSPATAYGVFMGIKAAVKQRLGRDDLEGLRFAVQGVGNVGYRLAKHLHENGAILWVTDLYDDRVERAVARPGWIDPRLPERRFPRAGIRRVGEDFHEDETVVAPNRAVGVVENLVGVQQATQLVTNAVAHRSGDEVADHVARIASDGRISPRLAHFHHLFVPVEDGGHSIAVE